MLDQKIKVAVVFGGKSGEHEVSLVSASSVITAIDLDKYEVVEVGISRDGNFFVGKDCLSSFKQGNYKKLSKLSFSTDRERGVLKISNDEHIKVDVFFPVLHGPFGEDGTIQGLFEMLAVPYVGSGVLASSTAMDKIQAKAIWQNKGLNVVDSIDFTRVQWELDKDIIIKNIEKNLGFPCFVKPVNMGSSVGVSKVKILDELKSAIELAAKFDSKILVEKAINARELECAILGNQNPIATAVGEVILGSEFYDFNDKYLDGKSRTQIPAELDIDVIDEIKDLSIQAFQALDCSGLARVDFFLNRDDGQIYINEINTMPGFTSISMYPKMVEYYGINYKDLVDRLIKLGFERFDEKQKNCTVFDSKSNWFS